MHPSTAQARVIVDELVRNTVSDVVLCPGSRNAPLSLACYDAAESAPPASSPSVPAAGLLRLHVRVDERSAGFLALGIAARTGRPVVLICTSGTAAANFHPAVAEADRAGVPLLVLTADRPPELRAAGANQVIHQQRLYGEAVRYYTELGVAEWFPPTTPSPSAPGPRAGQNAYWREEICRAWAAARTGPVHVNVPFREPLIAGGDDQWCEPLDGRPNGQRWTAPPDVSRVAGPVPSARRGLVVACGPDLAAACEWGARHGWPVIAETGAAGVGGPSVLGAGPWLLGDAGFLAEHRPEQVVCLGRPTVFRQVQALLSEVDVLRGLPQAPAKPADDAWLARWRAADTAVREAVGTVLAAEGWPTGPGVAEELLGSIPRGSLLVVGSSNPARDIALTAGPQRPDVTVHRNRGAAGIDGTVSTAIGAAMAHGGTSYALLGDLTFLHDVNGLLTGSLEQRPDLTVVVLNDGGGGIFSLLEQGEDANPERFERIFGTPHDADIAALCAGYRVPHTLVRTRAEFRAALQPPDGLRVVEVRAERSTRRGLHARLRTAVADALVTLTA